MKPKASKLLGQCIEDGVALGLNRAYKHTDAPSREQIQQAIEWAVAHEIHEWFDVEEPPR